MARSRNAELPGTKVPRKSVAPTGEPVRRFALMGIAALLAPVVRPVFKRRAPAAAALLADWEVLAGPDFAARAAPVKFAGGTLTLACTGPVAMELQHLAPQLIGRLNLGLGNKVVERLRFVRGAVAVRAAAVAESRRVRAAPAGLPAGALGEALARLYEGIAEDVEG